MTKKEKEEIRTLDIAIKNIEKSFGEGSIMTPGKAVFNKEVISTGIFSLDRILGVGGIPKGCIVEIYGRPSSGKSSLCMQFVGQVQKSKGVCVYIDMEHAFDGDYATQLGVDMSTLYIAQPSSAEEALGIVDELVKSGEVACVVVDSVASLVPKGELERKVGEPLVGTQAKMMSEFLRRINPIVGKTETILLFINQTRTNVMQMYGNKTSVPGGDALKFYAKIRLEVKAREPINGSGLEVIGSVVRIKAQKNKVAPPFKFADINFHFGKGFDGDDGAIDIAIDKGIIIRAGGWYSFGEIKVQGREKLMDYIDEIKEAIKSDERIN